MTQPHGLSLDVLRLRDRFEGGAAPLAARQPPLISYIDHTAKMLPQLLLSTT